jgi:hypothetical protein
MMRWERGTELFTRIAEVIESVVANGDNRAELYEEILAAFEDCDCDITLSECVGIDKILDEVLEETYGEHSLSDDEDDDEWPDGGREDFS